jgi:serine/threonine protein kinase
LHTCGQTEGPAVLTGCDSRCITLVEGVQALHAAKRLHRDLKPGNVLVTSSGRVVVLDFGLVRELDLLVGERSQTMVGGTPDYMAPEQALQGQVSEASDWYAVGVMLFQALAGKLPRMGSGLEVLAQNPPETLLEPRQIDPDIPENLNELCRRLLPRSAADRPDAGAILEAAGVASPVSVEDAGE